MGMGDAPQQAQESRSQANSAAHQIARMMWNIPDYVSFDETTAFCNLCESKSSGIVQLQNHLGGDKHAKKCRTQGYDEIIFVPARKRLEMMMTGKPVIRPGHTMPEEGEEPEIQSNPQDVNRSGQGGYPLAGAGKAKAAGSKPKENLLPAGYREYFDPDSGKPYYEEVSTGRTQWERPTVAAAVAPLPPVPPPKEDILPPGWKKVWDQGSNKYYYADIEDQIAQWTAPEPYVQGGWERRLDPANRAFWEGGSIKFYENDESWRRLVDEEDRTYWSNKELGIRFFEPET